MSKKRSKKNAPLTTAHLTMVTILFVMALMLLYALIKGPPDDPIVVVNDTPNCRDAPIRVLKPSELATEQWWGENC